MSKSWDKMPSTVLERAFQNRELALREAIRLKGGNRLEIQHLTPADRAALLLHYFFPLF